MPDHVHTFGASDPDRAVPCGHGEKWAGDVFYPCTHPDCVARTLVAGEVPPAAPSRDPERDRLDELARQSERTRIADYIDQITPHYEPDQYGVCDAQGALRELARDIRKAEHHVD